MQYSTSTFRMLSVAFLLGAFISRALAANCDPGDVQRCLDGFQSIFDSQCAQNDKTCQCNIVTTVGVHCYDTCPDSAKEAFLNTYGNGLCADSLNSESAPPPPVAESPTISSAVVNPTTTSSPPATSLTSSSSVSSVLKLTGTLSSFATNPRSTSTPIPYSATTYTAAPAGSNSPSASLSSSMSNGGVTGFSTSAIPTTSLVKTTSLSAQISESSSSAQSNNGAQAVTEQSTLLTTVYDNVPLTQSILYTTEYVIDAPTTRSTSLTTIYVVDAPTTRSTSLTTEYVFVSPTIEQPTLLTTEYVFVSPSPVPNIAAGQVKAHDNPDCYNNHNAVVCHARYWLGLEAREVDGIETTDSSMVKDTWSETRADSDASETPTLADNSTIHGNSSDLYNSTTLNRPGNSSNEANENHAFNGSENSARVSNSTGDHSGTQIDLGNLDSEALSEVFDRIRDRLDGIKNELSSAKTAVESSLSEQSSNIMMASHSNTTEKNSSAESTTSSAMKSGATRNKDSLWFTLTLCSVSCMLLLGVL